MTNKYKTAQRGITLVELLVALALSGVIALAAIASLVVARRGFTAVDTSSQMRDNGRFAMEMIQRIAIQSAYADPTLAAATTTANINGLDNSLAKIASATTATSLSVSDFISRTSPTPSSADSNCSSTADTACNNGSDVLVIRFNTTSDGSMVNCAGQQQKSGNRVTSIFHVRKNATNGEPSLMCTYYDVEPLSASFNTWVTQPLIEGVEGFQVLYGNDSNADSVPDTFSNATTMNATSSAKWTDPVWKTVRTLRIGIMMRGPTGSATSRGASLGTTCALGYNTPNDIIPQSLSSVPAPAFGDCVDPPASAATAVTSTGAEFPRKGLTVTDDGRLRQVMTFTINLRNVQ